MKKFNKKSLALLIVAALLLTITVGSTVAYLVDSTNALVNTFEPTEVDTELTEDFDGTVKKNIKVTNNGNIPVYVRIALIANYVDANGYIVSSASVPAFTLGNGWKKIGSYYYLTTPLAVDASSTLVDETGITLSTDTNGNRMQIVVLHQSIQAQPETVVEGTWDVNVINGVIQ